MELKRLFAASLGALALLAQPGMGADSSDGDKPAQKSAAPAKPAFKQEELDQMLAPIALYPDPLLAQVFIAATYPLEVVQAARWQKQNEKLTGEKLTAALEKQTWDPSVKAMVQIPSVLQMLSEKLEWTQKLGDAFLAQQPEVMATVQKLRKKALDAGNLKDSEQQKIITENAQATQVIRIEQTNPQTVYVPVYNTTWVYGGWWYPGYPPYGYYPMGYYPYYPATGFYYGAAWGLTVGWVAGANWNHAELYVNNNYTRINNVNIQGNGNKVQTLDQNGQRTWQHNPEHRQSVPYADRATQNKYSKQAPAAATANTRQQDYRGYDNANRAAETMNSVSPAALQDRAGAVSPEQRAAAQDRASSMSPADRAAAQERLGASGNVQNRASSAMPPMSDPYASRPSMDSARPSMDSRPAIDNNRMPQQPHGGGAFDSMGSGSSARMDSARGASSLGSAGVNAGARAGGGARMSGGGMRGGRR